MLKVHTMKIVYGFTNRQKTTLSSGVVARSGLSLQRKHHPPCGSRATHKARGCPPQLGAWCSQKLQLCCFGFWRRNQVGQACQHKSLSAWKAFRHLSRNATRQESRLRQELQTQTTTYGGAYCSGTQGSAKCKTCANYS